MPHSRYFACCKNLQSACCWYALCALCAVCAESTCCYICKVGVLLTCILHGSTMRHVQSALAAYMRLSTVKYSTRTVCKHCAHQYHLHWTPVAHYPAGKTLYTSDNLSYNIVDSSMLAFCFTRCKQLLFLQVIAMDTQVLVGCWCLQQVFAHIMQTIATNTPPGTHRRWLVPACESVQLTQCQIYLDISWRQH